jgi:hypothetical protein
VSAITPVVVVPDTFLRHRRVAMAVERVVPRGSVLNVGDTSWELQLHLPDHDVTCLDVLRPTRIPRGVDFVREDFSRTSLAPDTFDCVVALDVFEHISPVDRAEFLANAARVARCKAFLAFPAGDDADAVEGLIRASTTRLSFRRALEEHAALGLPALDSVTAMLDELGITHRWTPLTTVWEWLSSFVFDQHDGEDDALVADYCTFLNDRASADPGPGPYYRYLLELESTP